MFKDRTEAGRILAKKLESYRDDNVVLFALPRGGVETALPIARELGAPLDLIIPRKIGHPSSPEYAIAAIAENGHMVGNEAELALIDKEWLEAEKERQKKEAQRRRKLYLKDIPPVSVENKTAILVDDGVATGLTMRVAILELKHRNPKKIIVAVPVAPRESIRKLKEEGADEIIVLEPPEEFMGAVGAHYESFAQVEDAEVVKIIQDYHEEYKKNRK